MARKPRKRFGRLKISGIDFKWSWGARYMTDKDDFGESFPAARKTHINVEKHPTPAQEESTVLHEIIHNVLYLSGQSEHFTPEQEEALVLALENGLYPVIVQLSSLGYFKKEAS